ncbi:MAG: hypothetical protein H0W98_07365 [Chloroflexi bacterium]|nr:hypothetical protein [Chloroflexota bacterium]
MPLETRSAMLAAIGSNPIIVGAYADRDGGICPMLAAHRNGGRTSFASFATAWDRYARVGRRPRLATEREVRTLRTMLETSIARSSASEEGELGEAIAAHQPSRQERAFQRVRASRSSVVAPAVAALARSDSGERDRTRELSGRHGWAWLRPFRRLDEYELALSELAATDERSHELQPV